jgi:hypothetical protein
MRTKQQQQAKEREIAMMTDLKSAFARAKGSILQDAVGLLSLVAMLVVGLNLPDLI